MTASETAKNQTYFADDGSYGDAKDLLITDTSSWTSAMWDVIEHSTDSERVLLASHFVNEEHRFDKTEWDFDGNHKVCDTCELRPDDLP